MYNIPAGTPSMQPFMVEQRDAHGQSLHFGYNQDNELTTITDAQGKVTTLTYNGLGLVETVTDPFGRSAISSTTSSATCGRSPTWAGIPPE